MNFNLGKLKLMWPFACVLIAYGIFYLVIQPPNGSLTPADEYGEFGDTFGILNCLFSGMAFAAVVYSIQSQATEKREERAYQRSHFNLDGCVGAYERAIELIENTTNDSRDTWRHAARLLKHAFKLADGVTVDEHKRVLDYKKLEYRHFFRSLLKERTTQFFLGIDDEVVITDELWTKINKGPDSLKKFGTDDLRVVWQAAKPSDGWVEMTPSKQISAADLSQMKNIAPGLHDFFVRVGAVPE